MRSISNRDEANKYFQQLNDIVDEYIKDHKVRPSELHRYMKSNYKSIIDEVGLSDVDGINRVFYDVLNHRLNMERDGVMTFENFRLLNESLIDLEKGKFKYKKVLADLYNTSLGHIKVVDPKTHLYKVQDFGDDVYVFAYSSDDLKSIKQNIVNGTVDEIQKKSLQVSDIESEDLGQVWQFAVKDFLDKDKLLQDCDSRLSTNKLIEIITTVLQNSSNLGEISYKGKIVGLHLWTVNN